MKDVLVVVNPISQAGRTGRSWPAIAARLRAAGLDFDTAMTDRPLHAIDLARTAVRAGRPVVVAAGGDGTINEVANGFFEVGEPSATQTRLAVLPVGTGGDFRRTFDLSLEPEAAAAAILGGRSRRIDAGRVRSTLPAGGEQVRHFLNIADAGLGPEVVDTVNRSPKLLGAATFTLVSLYSLLRWRNRPMVVDIDGERQTLTAQQVVVANCQYYGGGMKVAPGAIPDDGLLDVILLGDIGRLESIWGLAAVRSGAHLDAGNAKWSRFRGRRVAVSSAAPVRVEMDGELGGVLPAVFEVQPAAIELVVP